MPLSILRDDITNRKTDAVVNAANSRLQAGGGVCGAIFDAAGRARLQDACDAIGYCPTGSAAITPGFNLPASFIIHAVGPVWEGGDAGESEKLASAYRSALELADKNGCASIAFPLISSGIYGVPKELALDVACRTFEDFLESHDMDIELVLFDRSAIIIGKAEYDDIREYIDDNYVVEHEVLYDRSAERRSLHRKFGKLAASEPQISFEGANVEELPSSEGTYRASAAPVESSFAAVGSARDRDLENLVDAIDETFSEMLLRLIDEKGYTDPEIYHRANMSRKLFSKIRSDANYSPSKRTVLSLAMALRLNIDEATDMLAKAGFAFSPASVEDLIVRYFIEHGNYDIFRLNEALYSFDQPLLCS